MEAEFIARASWVDGPVNMTAPLRPWSHPIVIPEIDNVLPMFGGLQVYVAVLRRHGARGDGSRSQNRMVVMAYSAGLWATKISVVVEQQVCT